MKKIIFILAFVASIISFAGSGIGGKYTCIVYDSNLPNAMPNHYYIELVENSGSYTGTLRTVRVDGMNEITYTLQNVVVNQTNKTIQFDANNIHYEGTIADNELHIVINHQKWVFKP
jgi:hypothetical protein